MKKFIFSLSALAALLLAGSCQRENLEPAQQGGTVTYTVQVPGDLATKASSERFELIYEVYRDNNTLIYESVEPILFDQNGKVELSLEFVKDQNFTVLFWAQKEGSEVYNVDNLQAVTLNTGLKSNDGMAEVFAGTDSVANCESDLGGNVVLVRPVAQLNIATTAAGLQLGTTATVTPKQSMVIVDGLYDTYNVATGNAGTKASRTYAGPTDDTQNVPGTDFKNGYKLMATNYLGFIPQAGDNVEVTFTIYTENDGNIEHTVSNVPVKANYQTNILGNLISAAADYKVTLENWADAGKDMDVLTDGLVKNINGDYEVSSVNGLAYAINNLFVDANGVANAKTFYVKPGLYDMAQQAINDITVTSGTLKVYDTEAVVTRSATIGSGSVVIKGLKKALIQKVGEDATVFFSGITVTDFNGADDAAALVQNNEGKVVLAGCDIDNEEGQNTELVGDGNDPVEVEKGKEEAGKLIYTAEQLAAAFKDESVESIALGADIVLENTLVFPEGRTATLDLRGWELTIADPDKVATTYALNNHGTLTIKDSYATGSVNASGIYNGFVDGGENISTAKLTIEGGTFNALGTNGGAAVFNYGIAKINSGNFTSIGGYSLNNQSGASMTIADGVMANNGIYNTGATLTINGGNIEGNRSGCHVVYSWDSTVTINGGTIHNNNSGNSTLMSAGTSVMTVNDGTFSIKDGRVEGNGNTWTSCLTDTQNTARLTINGGTFNGGFRVQGGTTMEITDGIFNDVVGSGYNVYEGATVVITGGSYNFDVNKWCHKDYKAVKNAETAMWDVVAKVYVAKIGEDGYESLNEAVAAVQDDETITLVANETFTEANRTHNTGAWYDGLYYIGDKSFTIDLGGNTISQNGAVNDYLLNFKNEGAKANTITLKNGTIDAGTAAFCAICTSSIQENELTINTKNINIINNMSNGSTIKLRGGAILNVNEGTIITGKNSYLGIESVASTVNIYDGAEIYMNGTSSYNGCLVGACAGGTVNVHGGYGKGVKGGFIAMTSGGTINVYGGEWIANTDGSIGDNSNLYVLTAQSNKNESGFVCGAFINVEGGTFRGGMDAWVLNNAPEEVAELNISGGNFNADPTNYLVEGYIATAGDDGIYIVSEKPKPAAKVGNTEYGTIDEAIEKWTNGSTLTLLSDVTLSDVVTLKSTEHHILNLSTFTMTAAIGKNAFEIKACGTGDAERTAITIKADAENPGGINAGNKCIVYYKYADGGISGNDRPIIKIEGGVFNGSTSAWGTAGIYTIGSEARKCATLNISGGTFNCSINGSGKSKLLISGGVFNYSVGSQGDSTALRLISGGTFKTLGFMTADSNNTKFWFGTSMGNSNVGLYINDDNYLVVGGPVITEFGDKFAAKATNATKWSSYLQYSSAAANGLYYTDADMAIEKHGEANVVLK